MTDLGVAGRRQLPPGDLPEMPPGTEAELSSIVHLVFGLPSRRGSEIAETTRRAVEENIRHLAADVLGELRMKEGSPRLSEEVERLKGIASSARELRRKLSAVDELTSALLRDDLRFPRHPRGLNGRPPPPSSATLALDLVTSPAEPVHPLEALARAAENTCRFIAERSAARSGSGSKTGANNLHGHLIGNLRAYLVFECAQILGAIQGAKAVKGTVGGKLDSLAAATWKYATGFDVEAAGGGGLSAIVKRVAPIARRIVVARDAFHVATDKTTASKELILAEAAAYQQLRRPLRERRPHSD